MPFNWHGIVTCNFIVLALVSTLLGCGKKGPLYLPPEQNSAPTQSQTPPETSKKNKQQ